MNKICSGIQWFWANHVQKTMATLLAGSAIFDLMNALLQYETDLSSLLGAKLYHGMRGACAGIILLRAVVQSHPKDN